MSRRWEVWALYDPPVRQARCWTRNGARRAMSRLFYPHRFWLSYELRDARGEVAPEVWDDYMAPARVIAKALSDSREEQP